MKKLQEILNKFFKEYPNAAWILFGFGFIATFALGLFATSIMERRAETKFLFQLSKPIDRMEVNSSKWKENFPREYERWRQTEDSSYRGKHGGSAKRDLLSEYPEMAVLWAGYAFSREYNQSRGHYNAVKDVREILRTGIAQPGTCWTCKSPDVLRLMDKGGPAQFYKSTWAELGREIKNPIGCLDCHNPQSMDLRVARPALAEAFSRQGKDLAKASHNEMRSLVCAQCHVEYFFKGKQEAYLTFPWDKGFGVEDMEAYYDENKHVDFVHALSKAPMLKAQHPDWELSKSGIHAQRGVSCADCHMPYRSEGGVKFTDHKIQSPLANVESSCVVCHGQKSDELIQNVHERQDKIIELRKQAQMLLVRAHLETKAALDKGATDHDIEPIHKLIRHAQWRWDYAVASIGGSFHAPLESARILATAIERAQEARVLLARLLEKRGVTQPVAIPDLSTKEKAQSFIGLDMKKLRKEKDNFLNTTGREWDTH